jgi:hypothetical protein
MHYPWQKTQSRVTQFRPMGDSRLENMRLGSSLTLHIFIGDIAVGVRLGRFIFLIFVPGHPSSLVLWCFFNALYAVYAASWVTLFEHCRE